MDPYDEVKSEIVSSLSTLSTLLSRHGSLSASHPPTSTELTYSISEIQATLDVLEGDLEELDESVRAVEERGVALRLGIPREEVGRRRAFVEETRGKLLEAQRSLGGAVSLSSSKSRRTSAILPASSASYGHPLSAMGEDDGVDGLDGGEGNDFEVQHQSYLMEQQDRTLTDISGTVGMLREQAKVMGREVVDQNELLDRLDAGVDDTSARLAKAQRKMAKFIEQNSSSPSSWFILILIIVLSVMLFIILFL